MESELTRVVLAAAISVAETGDQLVGTQPSAFEAALLDEQPPGFLPEGVVADEDPGALLPVPQRPRRPGR